MSINTMANCKLIELKLGRKSIIGMVNEWVRGCVIGIADGRMEYEMQMRGRLFDWKRREGAEAKGGKNWLPLHCCNGAKQTLHKDTQAQCDVFCLQRFGPQAGRHISIPKMEEISMKSKSTKCRQTHKLRRMNKRHPFYNVRIRRTDKKRFLFFIFYKEVYIVLTLLNLFMF